MWPMLPLIQCIGHGTWWAAASSQLLGPLQKTEPVWPPCMVWHHLKDVRIFWGKDERIVLDVGAKKIQLKLSNACFSGWVPEAQLWGLVLEAGSKQTGKSQQVLFQDVSTFFNTKQLQNSKDQPQGPKESPWDTRQLRVLYRDVKILLNAIERSSLRTWQRRPTMSHDVPRHLTTRHDGHVRTGQWEGQTDDTSWVLQWVLQWVPDVCWLSS